MLYFLLQYGILVMVCLYLINYYASKEVSMHVKVWSVITWTLNFGLALLVPQDVFQTLQGKQKDPENKSIGFQYLLLYWSVYLLTWTVIPVLQEWEDAGDLKSEDRLRRSLKINGYFYLVLIGISVVFLAIIIWSGVGQDMGLMIFLKCLASMWGMLLLMVFLGYSLVEIPKTMWLHSDPSKYLNYLYIKIADVEEDLEQGIQQFKRIITYIHYVKKNTNDQLILQYCNASESLVPEKLKSIVNSNSFQRIITGTNYLTEYPVCLQSSVEHNRLMKRVLARLRRLEKTLNEYVLDAIFFEDVQESANTKRPLKSSARKTNKIQSIWYLQWRLLGQKIFACVIGLFSVIILISETQVFLSGDASLLAFCLIFDSYEVTRVVIFIVMGFMLYMSNYALFRLKLANLYGLYKHESDGASLMFATVNFSRIGVAIVLNFFDMLKLNNISIFDSIMQTPEMGLLGSWVLKGLPGILWLIALCHYCNLWGFIANKLGGESNFTFQSHQTNFGQEEYNRGNKKPIVVEKKRRQIEYNMQIDYFRNANDHLQNSNT